MISLKITSESHLFFGPPSSSKKTGSIQDNHNEFSMGKQKYVSIPTNLVDSDNTAEEYSPPLKIFWMLIWKWAF